MVNRVLPGFVVRPASYPGTVAMAATDLKDEKWKDSCFGKEVDISAPGHQIYVPTFDKKKETYSYGSGTSYATPHVAAAAALWLHHHRDELKKKYPQKWQKVEAFRQVLKKSARKVPHLDPNKFGAGVLDAKKLLETKLPEPSSLRHAYAGQADSPGAESTLVAEDSITEKEIIYLAYNEVPLNEQVTLRESVAAAAETGLHHSVKIKASAKTRQYVEALEAGTGALVPITESTKPPATLQDIVAQSHL
ncbi:hypothetical protein BH24BAC1_BH24BAC1_16000 [soil metagenome]